MPESTDLRRATPQLRARDRAARRVAVSVRRPQSVVLDPVSDGRRGAAGLAGDRLDRAACGELAASASGPSTRTLVRVSDGSLRSGDGGSRRAPAGVRPRGRATPVVPLRRAVEMWRSSRCRSSCRASSSSLDGVASSARRITSLATRRASDSSSAAVPRRRAHATAQMHRRLTDAGSGEVVVDVHRGQACLPSSGSARQ